MSGGGAQREGERGSQAGSTLTVQSPMQRSISQIVRSWPELKSRVRHLTVWATVLISNHSCIHVINWSWYIYFFNVYLFLRDRERQHERGRGREIGRHRTWRRLQALSCQHRARRGARTHKLWDHDLSRSWKLNQLSHLGTPVIY